MKKLLVCVAFLLSLCACTSNKGSVSLTQTDAQYIRTGSDTEEVEFPAGSIFGTAKEFEQYKNENSFFDYSEVTFDFSSYDMLFIVLQEPSGSIRHSISEVTLDSEGTNVHVQRLIPEIGTDDMAEWIVIVKLDKTLHAKNPVHIESEDVKVGETKN